LATSDGVSRFLAVPAATVALLLVGCGLNVEAPDLFVLTRSGAGGTLTMLPNDSGSIRCNGGKAKPLSDPLLIDARQIATDLDADAKAKLHIPPSKNSVTFYTVKLQDGTISFPDTAASKRRELSETVLWALQAGQQECGS
jgi:hypothetical protein